MIMGSAHKGRVSEIRLFLEADSPQGLVRLQLQTNMRLKGQASFTDFTFADGKWFCWYMVDVDKYPDLLKQAQGRVE